MVGVVGSSPIVPTNSSDGSVELGSEVKLKWKRIRSFHFCFLPFVFYFPLIFNSVRIFFVTLGTMSGVEKMYERAWYWPAHEIYFRLGCSQSMVA